MEQGIWQEIEQLYQKFQQLGISEAVDYEKYYLYSLITHSTAIEGSTLTEAEAQMLFDEGLTAKGKAQHRYLITVNGLIVLYQDVMRSDVENVTIEKTVSFGDINLYGVGCNCYAG